MWQPITRGGCWWGGWPRWRWDRSWWKWGRWKLCYRLWLAYYFNDFFTLFIITLVETLFAKIFQNCPWWRVEIVRWKIFLLKSFIKVYSFIKDNLLKTIIVFCYAPIKFNQYPSHLPHSKNEKLPTRDKRIFALKLKVMHTKF